MSGFPIQVQEWLQKRELPGSAERQVEYLTVQKPDTCLQWSQSGDCTSVASGTACCALLRPNDMHIIRPSYLFHCFFMIPLPWSFLLNGLFEVASSNPNHTGLCCSNIVLAEVTSTEQEQACWHFVSLCSRPSICFS